MNRWRTLPLGEATQILRGITFKPADVVALGTPGSVGVMRTKNVQTALAVDDVLAVDRSFVKREEQLLRAGDILVSSANSWNLVGKACAVPELDYAATLGGFLTGLRADPRLIESRYLYRWLSSERTQTTVRSFARQTTSIANLDLKRFARLLVPLPPLKEQRWIADALDRADALRAKRRETLARLDELTQSIFVDMFGTIEDSPHPLTELDELLARLDSGKSPKCEDRPAAPGERGVLKLGAISRGTFQESENKAVINTTDVRDVDEIHRGDVLFARKNTLDLVGASAYVRDVRPGLFMPDLIFRLVPISDRIEPRYLCDALSSDTSRRRLRALAGGSAASMSNISKAKLRTLRIPVPPLERQYEYSKRAEAVDFAAYTAQRHLTFLDALFASLQQRAFRGDLFHSPLTELTNAA